MHQRSLTPGMANALRLIVTNRRALARRIPGVHEIQSNTAGGLLRHGYIQFCRTGPDAGFMVPTDKGRAKVAVVDKAEHG